jgi:Do/DeqQ family serine protease
MKKFGALLLVAILGGVIALGIYRLIEGKHPERVIVQQESLKTYPTSYPGIIPDDLNFVDVAEKTVNAVVHIRTEYQRKSSVYDYFFDWGDFFGNPNPYGGRGNPIVGYGSGVIIDPSGYIVTNNHVVQDASLIEVTLNDKRTYEATLVGMDPTTDLALIRVKPDASLTYLSYGNSDELKIGEWVLAVGNPFNLTSTVTAGIVSAKARNINILVNPQGTAIESFIQTDAAVNRGNSGGALVNTRGELVGVNAAIASGNGFYTGYSFAIPVNIVKKVVNDLKEFGEVRRAFIGVSVRELDSKFAKEKGLKDLKGVYVASVMDNGAAREAGIREGDVILSLNGTEVNHTSQLLELVGQQRPGDKMDVLLRRENKDIPVRVELKNEQGTTSLAQAPKSTGVGELGADFRPVTEQEKRDLGISGGLKVVNIKPGKLSEAGIRNDYIITHVNNNPVRSVDELKNALSGKKGGVLLEGIYTNGMRAYYAFGL